MSLWKKQLEKDEEDTRAEELSAALNAAVTKCDGALTLSEDAAAVRLTGPQLFPDSATRLLSFAATYQLRQTTACAAENNTQQQPPAAATGDAVEDAPAAAAAAAEAAEAGAAATGGAEAKEAGGVAKVRGIEISKEALQHAVQLFLQVHSEAQPTKQPLKEVRMPASYMPSPGP